MSSLETQFLNLKEHHAPYAAIDPTVHLKESASGKVVFLSGASRGIGRATAVAFALAGAEAVYVTARNEQALEETREKVLAANPKTKCAYKMCDVTDEDQVKNAVEDCVAQFGGIDVADTNAGYLGPWPKIAESDIRSWWRSWEVNVKGTYLVARFCLPYLIESANTYAAKDGSGGHLILLSSIGAQLLMEGASDYQASKHAINRLCEFINLDHGAEGVKCFAIHPGGVDTTLARNMPEELHPHLIDEPELAAGFIVWLCSGKVDWASGRYLSCTWDVNELLQMKEQILQDDLLVNRLRTTA